MSNASRPSWSPTPRPSIARALVLVGVLALASACLSKGGSEAPPSMSGGATAQSAVAPVADAPGAPAQQAATAATITVERTIADQLAAIAATSQKVAAAATDAHRSAAHVARNADRHPVETLAFFGLTDDLTVVEALPGAELWYTEVLAPVLHDRGQLVVASFDMDAPGIVDYQKSAHQALLSRMASDPARFGRIRVGELSPPHGVDLGPPGSADLVLTFRSTHGWLNGGIADSVYEAFFDVLRPGGVLGVEQHRAGPKTNLAAFSGYVPEAKVIEIAERAGFVLEARSEINANPKDTADWSAGVWTLPPTLRLGERDKAKYLAIGESDRMTLRFRKPATPRS